MYKIDVLKIDLTGTLVQIVVLIQQLVHEMRLFLFCHPTQHPSSFSCFTLKVMNVCASIKVCLIHRISVSVRAYVCFGKQ